MTTRMDHHIVPGASVADDRAVDFDPNRRGFNWHNRDRWKDDPDPDYDRAVALCDKYRDPPAEERTEATVLTVRDGWAALGWDRDRDA